MWALVVGTPIVPGAQPPTPSRILDTIHAAFPRQCLKGRPCSTGSVYSESMANLTLAIDDDLLQRAREAALRQHTTVNALVRDFLGRFVEARSRRLEALEQFEAVAAGSDSASRESWGRESLHDCARCGCSLTPTSGPIASIGAKR